MTGESANCATMARAGSTITKRMPVSQIGSAVTVAAFPARRPPRTGDFGSVTGAAATRKAAARPKRSPIAARPRSAAVTALVAPGAGIGVDREVACEGCPSASSSVMAMAMAMGRAAHVRSPLFESRSAWTYPMAAGVVTATRNSAVSRCLHHPGSAGLPVPRGDHHWPSGAMRDPGFNASNCRVGLAICGRLMDQGGGIGRLSLSCPSQLRNR